MILVKPSFEIEQFNGLQMLMNIEKAGRTCYKSESAITQDSAFAFVQKIIRMGHESVLEHEKISVRIICDRGVSHEIVRHRLASYSQSSTRYVDSAKGGCCFVIPPWVNTSPGVYSDVETKRMFKGGCWADTIWFYQMLSAEDAYLHLRNEGWAPQQARSVLPNSTKTELVMTANLREWRHFFKLRTSPAAHPQMREISIPLLQGMANMLPFVFDDCLKMEESK